MGPISTLSGTGDSWSEDRACSWPFASNLCRVYGYVMLSNHLHHSSRRSTWTPGKFNDDRIFVCWYLCYRTRVWLLLSFRHAHTQITILCPCLPSMFHNSHYFYYRLRHNVKIYYWSVFGRVAFRNHAPQCLVCARHMKATAVLSITSDSNGKSWGVYKPT
jgi:hypothetical protein